MSEVGASSVAVALAGEHADVRRAVELVGQILTGSVTSRTTLDGSLQATLGRSGSDLVCESRKLSSIGHVTAGLAIASRCHGCNDQYRAAITMALIGCH
jgi:transitional endoplasmic reticulum ATPase